MKLTIILPARNEADGLRELLPRLKAAQPDAEIIVVDDGSTDGTAAVCEEFSARRIHHPYPKGNGAAIKSGAKAATGDVLVMMDADGQHQPEDIDALLEPLTRGYDMAIAARDFASQASLARGLANAVYNRLASWLTGQKIKDLTSGFRACRASCFRQFLPLLPNGFSYPTTSTMAFFRAGYNVCFVPVTLSRRIGKSHLRPLRDGVRFLLIIFRVTTLYAPLKIFLPIAVLQGVTGLAYYGYTYLTAGRFTNMGVTLMVSSVLVFLIGLVSEQITTLLYARLADDS